VDEAEWLGCSDPQRMLGFQVDRASERKLRLLACACCRRIPGFLESQPDRQSLELTERDVDGLAEEQDFAALPEDVWDIRWYRRDGWGWITLNRALNSYWDYLWVSRNLHATTEQVQAQARRQSDAELAVLVSEVFGNPFRPVALDPSLLTWHGGLLVSMAQRMYDSRDFTDMPVLADALEEAGCSDTHILNHCRQPVGHVRGCWVVDPILGKE
jgi:hypothetical protein